MHSEFLVVTLIGKRDMRVGIDIESYIFFEGQDTRVWTELNCQHCFKVEDSTIVSRFFLPAAQL
jgi:hypothetical protein